MVKIGVVSDTHLSRPSRLLASLVEPRGPFADAEMVLHAGDIVSLDVLSAFAPKTVFAVAGNMDGYLPARELPARRIVEVMGFKIGLIHGNGPGKNVEDRVFAEFPEADAICYGHTHVCANHYRNGILLFNPGSFGNGTVGVLTVTEKGIQGTIVNL
ncbi:MAG: YfcE family phosphodiesterase [Thermodesulfobacteriota bacterium]